MIAGAFLESTIRWATPFAFAALGECISERAGVINIGLEGSIITGALAATIAAGVFGTTMGFVAGAAAGLAIAALFALFAVLLRSDQIITGTAITMFGLGLTGSVYRFFYGVAGVSLTTPTSPPFPLPLLSKIPVVGQALFVQPPVTYLLYVVVPIVAWWLAATHGGLALRAVGERPIAAAAAGIRPRRVQFIAVLFAGLMAGIAGATLVLAQAGTFVEGMSAGRGFIAIAVVVLGRWQPLGVVAAALLFGAAYTLQNVFQSMGFQNIPYNLFLAAPYILTLVVLAGSRSRVAAPAALGKSDLSN